MPVNIYQEFISCQSSFVYFVENYVKIANPIKGDTPFVLYPYQKRLIETLGKNKFILVKKFRQGGFTTLALIYSLWKCLFHSDQHFYFVSKSEGEAIHLGKYISKIMDAFPSWFVKPTKNTQNEKAFITESTISFGIMEGVRGRCLTNLVIDEAAFIPGMNEKWKLIWNLPHLPNVGPSGPSVLVISTVNGPVNWFCDVWTGAIEGKNNFLPFSADYWEHPDYNSAEWVAQMKAQLGEKGFMQEVLGEFVIDRPEFDTAQFVNLDKHDLIQKSLRILELSKLKFQDKALIYEMIHRFASGSA